MGTCLLKGVMEGQLHIVVRNNRVIFSLYKVQALSLSAQRNLGLNGDLIERQKHSCSNEKLFLIISEHLVHEGTSPSSFSLFFFPHFFGRVCVGQQKGGDSWITRLTQVIHKWRKSLFCLSLSRWAETEPLIFCWAIVRVSPWWAPLKFDPFQCDLQHAPVPAWFLFCFFGCICVWQQRRRPNLQDVPNFCCSSHKGL